MLVYTWVCDGPNCTEQKVDSADSDAYEYPETWVTASLEEGGRTVADPNYRHIEGIFCTGSCRLQWIQAHLDNDGSLILIAYPFGGV